MSLVALSRRPDVAAAVGILNDQALRAGVIAGVIGVLVGLLLAQLIALRLRRLSAAAEAIALGDFESPLSYRVRDEFGALAQSFDRMRRQLRRSFRHIEGERDRLRLLLERLHEGVVTVDDELVVHFVNAEARRVLGVRVAEGDPLPEPWESFSLRGFAAGLFESDASLAQAHVHSDAEHALGLVGIPAQPEGRHGADRARRPDRAGAARACRARVRHERGARAAHAVDDDHRRGRGAAGRREGGSRPSATAFSRTSSARRSGSRGSHARC